ncbi:formylmethanofuran dehydrogenase subunit A [Desulfobaculum xiamenense]|uniref:Formylmethanofuran dehydrogenase subunit A n=1 Tax=Desulfobaculum xiamenense TaxID=995050 RepID=A0A846QM84_9BACT|nr:DUF3568 domain-containing protein [Desulfobaculum xiamenense]NJB66364.1 formylmethanofuran dehydrogenase subunit A [Desulfobaculum xiamenense]
MKMIRNICLVLMLAAAAAMQGCAVMAVGAVAGGGTYAYVTGNLERSYNADVDSVYESTLRAARRLNLTVEDKEINLSSGSISGKDQDRSYWVRFKATNPHVTLVSVRVGLLGDEIASRRIHEAIASGL